MGWGSGDVDAGGEGASLSSLIHGHCRRMAATGGARKESARNTRQLHLEPQASLDAVAVDLDPVLVALDMVVQEDI